MSARQRNAILDLHQRQTDRARAEVRERHSAGKLNGIDWSFEKRKAFAKATKRPARRWRINWWPALGLLALAASAGWVAAVVWSLVLLGRRYIGGG